LIFYSGGGENIAPVPIEEKIKQELAPVVSYAMLVGTRQLSIYMIN
jgi:long-subunit acyl-CoA synthetase (AMP-forming)